MALKEQRISPDMLETLLSLQWEDLEKKIDTAGIRYAV